MLLSACSGGDENKAVELELGERTDLCLDVPSVQDESVDQLDIVGCELEHTHEVMAVFESESKVYPGFDALEVEAQLGCLDRFEGYVGTDPFDSTLFYSWLVPSLASWSDAEIENGQGGDKGDRQIICVVGQPGDEPVAAGERLYQSRR
jgi:hypothetical protein